MHLFTYGSLMFAEVWQRVVGRSFNTAPARLRGFEVYRVSGATYPGMVPGAVSSVVQGIVYLDIDATSLARIDAFEAGHYVREHVVVVDDAQRRLDCWAYVVRSDFAQILTEQTWTADWFAKHGLAKFLDRYAGFNDHPRDV